RLLITRYNYGAMTMLQKKVCMVGAFATGKTSLVAQFVKGIYSEKYQTTVGVKIDKKVVETEGTTLSMVLWDIHGEDEFQNVRMSYLRGSAAYLLVIDGTRRSSLDVALNLKAKVAENIGNIPFVVVINKYDLHADWEITTDDIRALQNQGLKVIQTSAKTSLGVESSFQYLAKKIIEQTMARPSVADEVL
ncbi:MAG: Rab family GTPase, partial [Cyanobacteria bacterium J06607_10]